MNTQAFHALSMRWMLIQHMTSSFNITKQNEYECITAQNGWWHSSETIACHGDIQGSTAGGAGSISGRTQDAGSVCELLRKHSGSTRSGWNIEGFYFFCSEHQKYPKSSTYEGGLNGVPLLRRTSRASLNSINFFSAAFFSSGLEARSGWFDPAAAR